MGQVRIGINLEFVRHDDKPFEWGVEKAAQLGYVFVEPMAAPAAKASSTGRG